MAIFRIMFLACLAFIGAVALFMGGVVMLTSWQNGAIMLSYTVDGQAVTLATNHVFLLCFGVFLAAAALIWLAPRPQRTADMTQAH